MIKYYAGDTPPTLEGMFFTRGNTGALVTPSVGPAGTLYLNGVANAATVTITGSNNPYKWSVTLPAIANDDVVQVYMTATIGGVATGALVFVDVVMEGVLVIETEDLTTLIEANIGALNTNVLAAPDAVLDEPVEGTTTMRELLRLFAAVMAGKASGGGTTSVIYRDLDDTKPRVSMTVDASGNRSAVTLDAT